MLFFCCKSGGVYCLIIIFTILKLSSFTATCTVLAPYYTIFTVYVFSNWQIHVIQFGHEKNCVPFLYKPRKRHLQNIKQYDLSPDMLIICDYEDVLMFYILCLHVCDSSVSGKNMIFHFVGTYYAWIINNLSDTSTTKKKK